jgi:diacylglycerol kinase family enzyme
MATPATFASLERLAAHAGEARTPGRSMLVIVNPHATTVSGRLKNLVVYALRARFDVDTVDTEGAGHAVALCRDAAGAGFEVVVAFGGDGTVNEAANGLAGSDTTLACLPGGSNNVFHRMIGMPADIVDATEHLLALADSWAPRQVDLGRLGDRAFTFAAGAGLDASVVERVDRHPKLKSRFKQAYYAEAAVATFLRRYIVNPPRLVAEVGGEQLEGVTAIVQNGPIWTYFNDREIRVAEGAELNSGDLAGAVLDRASPLDMPTFAYRALSQRASVTGHRHVHPFTGVGAVTLRSIDDRPLPLHVDGDYIGEAAVAEFRVDPGALRVVG